jgi:hypothetical protein
MTVAGDLKNACLAFGIFQLLITILELLLLPIYGGFYLLRSSNASRDVRHTSTVSRNLEKVRLTFGIFLLSLAVTDLLLLPVGGNHI